MSKVKKILTEGQINAIELLKKLENAAFGADDETMNVESQKYSEFADLSDGDRLNSILKGCGLPHIDIDDIVLPDSSDYGRSFTDVDIDDGHYDYTATPAHPEDWESYEDWLNNSGAYRIYRAGTELIRRQVMDYLSIIDSEYIEGNDWFNIEAAAEEEIKKISEEVGADESTLPENALNYIVNEFSSDIDYEGECRLPNRKDIIRGLLNYIDYINCSSGKLYNPNDPASNQIKDVRASTHLSQAGFAERYNIPKRTIENWESGVSVPPTYVIELLEFKIKSEKK